tara:strand:+ start:2451 stop:3701 length:1251 start_codon:yes stop_codon:yes gene_type:complete
MAKYNKNNFKFVKKCQNCNYNKLSKIHSFGFHPTVNDFKLTDSENAGTVNYPLDLLYCKRCDLVQLGIIIHTSEIFPRNYAYRSGTTKILINNFLDLRKQVEKLNLIRKQDLVIDIGSNDGTLLKNFVGNYRLLGVEPTDVAKIAQKNKIDTLNLPFSKKTSLIIKKKYGKAKLITAANVFAHIENVHDVMKGILNLLDKDGVFISESHYLISFLKDIQYDTVYHEHLRYYSLNSLQNLFKTYGMEIFHVKKIPTHGGSIRVFASKIGTHKISASSRAMIMNEPKGVTLKKMLDAFSKKTSLSKLSINKLLYELKLKNKLIFGISAPSRASTLINYLGLDNKIINYISEVKGSLKIGKNIPGTNIPVVLEEISNKNHNDIAIIFSWHIKNELMNILRKKGFKGKFIIPLPRVKVVK